MPSSGRRRRGPRPTSRAMLDHASRKRPRPCAIRIAKRTVRAAEWRDAPQQAHHDPGPDRCPRPRPDLAATGRAALPGDRRGRDRSALRGGGGALSGTARARRGRGAHGRLRDRQPAREPRPARRAADRPDLHGAEIPLPVARAGPGGVSPRRPGPRDHARSGPDHALPRRDQVAPPHRRLRPARGRQFGRTPRRSGGRRSAPVYRRSRRTAPTSRPSTRSRTPTTSAR